MVINEKKGPFCEAFGIIGIKAPSIEKKHKQNMIPYKKHKPKKYKYTRNIQTKIIINLNEENSFHCSMYF